jgi:integrase/recombinase XerD
MTKSSSPSFPALVQEFFCQRLTAQRNASPETVASYRDTFCLLLAFAEDRLKKTPAEMEFADVDAPLVLDFLDHLESNRGNGVRTRNLRLTAIRSFMKFVSTRSPSVLVIVQRVLAIPAKRFDRSMVGFLSRDEIDAIIAAPDTDSWSGRRDHVLFAALYNTGARVSEIIGVRRRDLSLDRSPFVHLHGKGRKERSVPLWRTTRHALHQWLTQLPESPEQPIFPNRAGHAMSRSGVEERLESAVRSAAKTCPSLCNRRISPHTLRHTTAMHLLQSGVDITVIALWLGHESPTTTHLYVEADLQMKERALARVQPAKVGAGRYRPGDTLLAFLEGL